MNYLYVVIAAVSVLAGVQTVRLKDVETEYAEARAVWANATTQAVQAARTEEQRRTQAVQKEVHHARTKATALAGDLAAARDAGQRLRDALAALNASASCGAPATSGSPATDPTADLRALVQRRLDEATDGVAGFADQSHLAGTTCQRSWGTLTAPEATTP